MQVPRVWHTGVPVCISAREGLSVFAWGEGREKDSDPPQSFFLQLYPLPISITDV